MTPNVLPITPAVAFRAEGDWLLVWAGVFRELVDSFYATAAEC